MLSNFGYRWGRQAAMWLALLALVAGLSSMGSVAIAAPLSSPVVMSDRVPPSTANLERGKQIFQRNCTACHAGGRNLIVPDKNLSLEALRRYDKNSITAIVKQVTYGNGVMPPFGSSFSDEDIINVASYVLNQAQHNWNSDAALRLDARLQPDIRPAPGDPTLGRRMSRFRQQHQRRQRHMEPASQCHAPCVSGDRDTL